MEIVATNVVASRTPELQLTLMSRFCHSNKAILRKAKLLRWENLITSNIVLWNCGYDGLFSYHGLLQYNLWISLYLLFVANSEAVLIQNHPLILFDWWSSTILIEWAHYPYLVTNTQILKNNKKVKIGLETTNPFR